MADQIDPPLQNFLDVHPSWGVEIYHDGALVPPENYAELGIEVGAIANPNGDANGDTVQLTLPDWTGTNTTWEVFITTGAGQSVSAQQLYVYDFAAIGQQPQDVGMVWVDGSGTYEPAEYLTVDEFGNFDVPRKYSAITPAATAYRAAGLVLEFVGF